MSGRPLDVLEAAVGDDVEVRLKSGEIYRGTLAGYDQHMNLVLDDVVESPEATDATDAAGAVDTEASADAPDGTAAEDADGPDDAGRDTDGDGPADVQDTTIIRGDNVVSITP